MISVLYVIFTLASFRRRRCEQAGTHRPVLIDLGRRKLCMNCCAW